MVKRSQATATNCTAIPRPLGKTFGAPSVSFNAKIRQASCALRVKTLCVLRVKHTPPPVLRALKPLTVNCVVIFSRGDAESAEEFALTRDHEAGLASGAVSPEPHFRGHPRHVFAARAVARARYLRSAKTRRSREVSLVRLSPPTLAIN